MKNQKELSKRLKWVLLYEKCQNAGLVCLKCGISRPTLRKSLRRYQMQGEEGLNDHSRNPHSPSSRKVGEDLEKKIALLRQQRNLGARRIQNELIRLYSTKISLATIHKVLQKGNVKLLSNRAF